MSLVQEIYIAAIEGLTVPEGLTKGSVIEVTCRLQVARVTQDWIDVTTIAGKPEQLPGAVTVGCVAIEWKAT